MTVFCFTCSDPPKQQYAHVGLPGPILMEPDLLNEIFRFKYKPPSVNQEESVCRTLVNHFCAFVKSIRPVEAAGFAFSINDPLVDDRIVPLHVFAEEEHKELQRVCEILTRSQQSTRIRGDIWIEKWLPQYGCALQMEMVSVSNVALKLVFLDGWEHVMHFPPRGECIHTAIPKKFSILNCGSVHPSLRYRLLGGLNEEIEKAKKRTGTERSAAFNEIGHQKTPQFIATLLRNVQASLTKQVREASVARGGTTDVGLHTGGRSRDTCWPLVQGVLKQNLPGSGALFDKSMLIFKVSLLSGKLNEVVSHTVHQGANPRPDFWGTAQDTFAMLQSVVLLVVDLVQRGYDVTTLEAKCAVIRKHVLLSIKKINAHTAASCALPIAPVLGEISNSMKNPKISHLDYVDVYQQSAAEDYNVEAHARSQLTFFDFVDPKTCSAGSLISWLSSSVVVSVKMTIRLVALRTIESFVFRKASLLWKTSTEIDADCSAAQLKYILAKYEEHLQAWEQASLPSTLMEVEQHSRELLVKWAVYCLAHRAFAVTYKELRNFGIALQWNNLDVAVLREQSAVDALSSVASYIRSWNTADREPIFDLNNQVPTAKFARAFAATSGTYLGRYNDELHNLEQQISSKWASVIQKRAQAAAIRAEIKVIEDSIEKWQEKLEDEKETLEEQNEGLPWNLQRHGNRETKQYKDQIRSLKSWRNGRTKALEEVLRVPGFIVNPLPKDQLSALQTLFFLNPPADIALLFELCLLAQRSLAPRRLSVSEAQLLRDDEQKAAWLDFYNKHSTVPCSPESTNMPAYQSGFATPKSHGPASIESLKNQGDYAKLCVWYPSENKTQVFWTGAAGLPMNPFKIPRDMMISYFTHQIPPQFKHLQWAIAYPGGKERGNLVYSKVNEQLLDDFEKNSFILFGSVRAFPNQQIRKICCALKDNLLPWSHPCVIAVVRQAMYQVGELTDHDVPRLLWKSDIQRADGLEALLAAIDQAADRLSLTPRDFENVPLLSELAGFVSQLSSNAKTVVIKFVKMCRCWADGIRKHWQSDRTISSSESTELRAKECLLYGYALQSYGLGPLDDSAAVEVGELIVLYRNAMLFSTGSKLWPALQRLDISVAEIMTRRIAAVFHASYYTTTMTSLVRLVNTRASNELDWRYFKGTEEGHFTSYMYATEALTGTIYAINLFSGMILTDGNSPGGLPPQIRQSERYREMFGKQDFEVSFSKGVYRTVYAVQGCYFDFSVIENELHVREVYCDKQTKVTKMLDLCSSKWTKALGAVLPARLVHIYSLWYWIEKKCILVRSPTASVKNVYFVIFIEKTMGADPLDNLTAYQVAMAKREAGPEDVVACRYDYDTFKRIDDRLLKVLRKFEAEKYIHTLSTQSGALKINLPRYRLNFVLGDDHKLASQEYKGYVLDQQQQFEDVFPNFQRYLVLRLATETAFAKPKTRILIPLGEVVKDLTTCTVDIAISESPSAKLEVAVFDVHRRLQTLSTDSITSRLLLCALLASTGLNIPSEHFKMTGSEAALQALKGCYFSHQFSKRDKYLLQNLCSFGHLEPALKILASSILQKSRRCSFLSAGDGENDPHTLIDCNNELDEYSAMCVQFPERNPLRARLDHTEERLVLGSTLQHDMTPKRLGGPLFDLGPSPVKEAYVHDVEETLSNFLAASTQVALSKLPLTLEDNDAMSKEMNAELHRSWKAYHQHPEKRLKTSMDSLATHCELQKKDVQERRAQVERYLLDSVKASRNDITSRLLFMVNYLPSPTVVDIVRSAIDNEVLLNLVPRLSLRARSIFKAATLQYMELCVLEDKLKRLHASTKLTAKPSPSYFVDELSSVRKWKSEAHPYWLAFEVEGRLQIRHEQYVVADHLIDEPGSVCQMNMGRGKTRVILPMLFLYFSHRHRGQVVRAHFLTPLLSETRQFMHQYLSASSILNLNFVEQPFHRNIDLNTDRLNLLREDLEEAKECGKFLMVAPEHRMSLELKRLDLESSDHDERDSMMAVLDDILDNDQYVDILDESDAILHHKYHLIYAVGVPQQLENGEDRWLAAEALLRIIAGSSGNRVTKLLLRPHVCFLSSEYMARLGGYSGLRLNASVENKDKLRKEFKESVVLDLMSDPPFSLSWLKPFGSTTNKLRDRLVEALTNPTESLEKLFSGDGVNLTRFRSQLLALRGLIAFGILEHCLEKRHRVEYGLPDRGTRGKRMSIPFRAADIPSERSEFSHPEVGITLTVLGYYHTGLSETELKEALKQLLLLGFSEQDQFYSKWYDSVKDQITADDMKELPRDARQLSPRDSRQFALVHKVYRYTMETINFFLNTCVFPKDTTQYPKRLSRTAWNLAGGSWNMGFSGTNDNHRLLPDSMKQVEPKEPTLLGTNGKMIARIQAVFEGYEVIYTGQGSAIPWQSLLRTALDKDTQALIDTGALLAGVLNNDAALYLLDLDDFFLDGVTYYDTRPEFDCWVVLDASSRLVAPLKKATILEKDTFVIFDDARSRGSDMKLNPDAVAMLTLGPKLTKDKMMQGAGRMRQLGSNQKLWLASLDEVQQSILRSCNKENEQSIDIVDILDWVMRNTKSEAIHGLLEWANSGLQFNKSQNYPETELLEEDWSLQSLYASAQHPELISNIVVSKAAELYGYDDDDMDVLTDVICQRGLAYGIDEEILVTAHNEECERELHNEHFEERQGEVERARFSPSEEIEWDYNTLLRTDSARRLINTGIIEVKELGDFVRESISPPALSQIQWSGSHFFGTRNFFSTVTASGGKLNAFARVIDAVLFFDDGTKLLLSEYEADQVLRLLWTSSIVPKFSFVNLPYLVHLVERDGKVPDLARVPLSLGSVRKVGGAFSFASHVSVVTTSLCQLYNGETMFTKNQKAVVTQALRQILGPLRERRETTFQAFAEARGNLPKWRFSLLHELCHTMDFEDFAAPVVLVKKVGMAAAGA